MQIGFPDLVGRNIVAEIRLWGTHCTGILNRSIHTYLSPRSTIIKESVRLGSGHGLAEYVCFLSFDRHRWTINTQCLGQLVGNCRSDLQQVSVD